MNILDELVNWYQSNSTIDILIAVAIILFSCWISSLLSYIIIKIFTFKNKEKKVKKSSFYKPLKIFFILLGMYISLIILKLPQNIMEIINKAFKIIVICLTANGIGNIIGKNSILYDKLRNNEKFKENKSLLTFVSKLVKAIVYIIAAFVILQEFGYNLNGVVTGLGLGSVVLALAVQDVAKSLLAGIIILIDKPFSIGDLIEVKEYKGNIEDIKFRSTKIRLIDGSLLNLPNEVLMTETITNWTKIKRRRYELNLELMLNTKIDKVENVIIQIKETLKKLDSVIIDSIQISFDKITANGMNLYIYLDTTKIEYKDYLKFTQEVNIQIMKILEKENISLAYNSQDIYIHNN